jgi:uncharacterized protein (DUF4415 family)
MKKKMVSFVMDLHNPPPLSEEELARLNGLDEREVDFSDIPRLTPEFFKEAIRNPWFKPIKKSTTVRIDADILAWLRAPGKGYQSRINEILRRAMFRAQVAERKAAEEQRRTARAAANPGKADQTDAEPAALSRGLNP